MNKKIIIPGGSGFLGMSLAKYFASKDYEVNILTRQSHTSQHGIRFLAWNGRTVDDWARSFEHATAIINLSGRSVNCRYTEANKAQILESRLNSTKAIGQAIMKCQNPPKVWLNSSSATIYEDTRREAHTEEKGIIGDDFSMNVCKEWEKIFFSFNTEKTRRVAMRTSIVLGKDAPAMKILMRLVKLRLGGVQGCGTQYFSWLHIHDFIRIVEFLMEHEEMDGVVNCAAPNPVTNAEQMAHIRKAAGVHFGLPSTEWMLKIGAFILGTETELVLKSRKVVPKKLLDAGFEFNYSRLEDALQEIMAVQA